VEFGPPMHDQSVPSRDEDFTAALEKVIEDVLSDDPSVSSNSSSDLRSRADWSLRVAARRRFGCLTHGPGCG
jgi:hypothetical protein